MTDKISVVNINGSSQNYAGKPLLRNGSVVHGRVLSVNSDGSYTVSIAGQKLSVKVHAKILPGTEFSARVKVDSAAQNSKIALVLLKNEEKEASSFESYSSKNLKNGLDQKISDFLKSLGLPPDSDSFRLLQTMQQFGAKFNMVSAKKMLSSMKRSENKTENLETSFLLDEKGILLNDDTVKSVSDILHDEKDNESESKNQNSDLFEKNENSEITADDIKLFFNECNSAALEQNTGILTVLNSVRIKNSSAKNWIVLPFDWLNFNSKGSFKMLFDSSMNILERIIIFLKKNDKKFSFVLYLKDNKIHKTDFSVFPEISLESKHSLERMLREFLNISEVNYEDFSNLSGFASGMENISMFRGQF